MGACQIMQSAGMSLGDADILLTAADLFFHLPLSGMLISAAVVHRGLDNLGKGKEENKGCFWSLYK